MAMGKVSGIDRKLVKTMMESAEKEIRNAMVVFKSKVWDYFGFFNQEGKRHGYDACDLQYRNISYHNT